MEKPRRWYRRWFIPLTVAFLLIAVGVWWYTCLSPMAKLRASGAPTTLADLIAKPIPDDQNVAAGLRELQTELGKPIDELSVFHGNLEGPDIPPDQLGWAKTLLQPHQSTVDALLQVINRPSYASTITPDEFAIEQLLETSNRPRQAARLLSFATHVALAEGKIDQAVETTLATLRLAKLAEEEPSMLRKQIACAVQMIALRDTAALIESSKLSSPQAERLDEALAAIEHRSSLEWTLQSERVVVLNNLKSLPLPVRVLERGGILKLFERAIEVADTPLEGLAAAGKAIAADTGTQGLLLAPAIQSLFESEARLGLQARGVRESLKDMPSKVAD